MESEAVVIRRKMIGVQMRAAREKAHRTVKEIALRLGVTPARVRQYESGARAVSLLELENLSLFLQQPLSFFLSGASAGEEAIVIAPTQEDLRARRATLGAKLREARLAAGKSKEECAQVIGRKPATIGRYERGRSDISITELEQLAGLLQVNLFHFVEEGDARADRTGVLDLEKLARLPRDVRAFVLNVGNLPYLRMAMKFSDLPSDKLKELGEILLVVR